MKLKTFSLFISLVLVAAAAWYLYLHIGGRLERDWWVPLLIVVVIVGLGRALGRLAAARYGKDV